MHCSLWKLLEQQVVLDSIAWEHITVVQKDSFMVERGQLHACRPCDAYGCPKRVRRTGEDDEEELDLHVLSTLELALRLRNKHTEHHKQRKQSYASEFFGVEQCPQTPPV